MEGARGILHRATVMAVLEAALKAADPYLAVTNALSFQPAAGSISVITGKIYVVGAGKASSQMARAVEEALADRISEGLVIVKDGYASDSSLPHIRIAEASHPVPDWRGLEATTHILDMAERAGEDDLVICLISGGGSALLVGPCEGVTLQDLQAVTQLLLRSGATINELNAVRKHLSDVSGGLLARKATPARVLSLVLSDVTGSPLDVIASGPTAPDPTTYGDAMQVLERYGLVGEAPASVVGRLRQGMKAAVLETPKPGDPIFKRVSNVLVASNVIAVEAAAAQARSMDLDTIVASTYLEGEARDVGTVIAGVAKEMRTHGRPVRRPGCVLFGGETTVTVRGEGTGGRNTELALSAAIALDGWGPDLVVASLATDGGDGTSPSAGAIADGTTVARGRALGLDASQALANNDSYTYFHRLGDALQTGPTGTNVNDVMAAFAF